MASKPSMAEICTVQSGIGSVKMVVSLKLHCIIDLFFTLVFSFLFNHLLVYPDPPENVTLTPVSQFRFHASFSLPATWKNKSTINYQYVYNHLNKTHMFKLNDWVKAHIISFIWSPSVGLSYWFIFVYRDRWDVVLWKHGGSTSMVKACVNGSVTCLSTPFKMPLASRKDLIPKYPDIPDRNFV